MLCERLEQYSQVLVCAGDNVGSTQLQGIKKGLRPNLVVLMGKNIMMKRSIRIHAEKTGNSAFLNLIPLLVGNVCLIFTKGDLKEVSKEVGKYKMLLPANASLLSQVLDYFHLEVLNIPTKINKGTVEIVAPLELIHKGEKVGSSEAALLAKLGIRPFSYSLVVSSVYDNGSMFSPEVLDLTEKDLISKFSAGVSNVAALSLGLGYPTLAAAPHMFVNTMKNVLSVSLATEYSFRLAEIVKDILKDPGKLSLQWLPRCLLRCLPRSRRRRKRR